MKQKLIAIVMAAACACALCFVLVGCGDNKANFVGDWELETIESDSMGTIDATVLKQMNMSVTLTLNEDGSADFVMFGQSIDATWVENGAATMTLTLSGEGDAVFVLSSDGKLSSDDGDTTMIFVRAGSAA